MSQPSSLELAFQDFSRSAGKERRARYDRRALADVLGLVQGLRPIRCGWCIGEDHEHCVTILEMGRKKARDKYGMDETTRQQPYIWRCGCGCPTSLRDICVSCRRPNTETKLEKFRCKDVLACRRARDSKKYRRPPAPKEK